MNNGAFSPSGPTVLVGTTEVQVSGKDNNYPTAYRVRNLLTTTQYFSWAPMPAITGSTPSITVTVPSAGVPSANTIGMGGGGVEVFGTLPPNAYFKANAAGAFEITPGEGL